MGSEMCIRDRNDGKFPEGPLSVEADKKANTLSGDEESTDTPPEKLQEDKNNKSRFSAETPFETRYFMVTVNENGEITDYDLDRIAAVDEETAETYTQNIQTSNKTTGFQGIYRYRVIQTEEGQKYVFLDCRREISNFRAVLVTTIAVSVLGLAAVFVLVVIFSRMVFRPVEESIRKQKQFITDASHELKTPLAIISANAEVLQYKGDGNEWTQNIIDQTKHMGKLINQLLVLAKLDEVQEKSEKQEADLKLLLEETTRPFEEVATQKKVTLKLHLEEGVTIRVNREQIAQLVSILTENAAKYVNDGGKIVWRLTKTQHGAVLVVKNTTEKELPDTKRMFDRFYRSDSSRSSKTGGQGIGLSIAKKIVDSHKGSITAKAGDGMVTFRVSLPK